MKTRIVWGAMESPPRSPPEPRRRYGLVVEDIDVDGFHCESYGVVIADEATGEEDRCRHVTVNAAEAVELLHLLARGEVSPVTLTDVVEDWLAR